MYSIVNVVLL